MVEIEDAKKKGDMEREGETSLTSFSHAVGGHGGFWVWYWDTLFGGTDLDFVQLAPTVQRMLSATHHMTKTDFCSLSCNPECFVVTS